MQELEESRLETIDMTLSKMSATLGKTNAPLPPHAVAHFRKATGRVSVLNDISGFAATVGCDCREPADELLPPARALEIAALRPPKDAPNGGSFWENVLWKPLRSLASSLAQPTGRTSVGQSEMLQVHLDPEPQCATHMPHPILPLCHRNLLSEGQVSHSHSILPHMPHPAFSLSLCITGMFVSSPSGERLTAVTLTETVRRSTTKV